MKNFFRSLIAVLFITSLLTLAAQDQPDSLVRNFRNTITINISSPLIISPRFFTLGYERILPKNQSFTVNIGTFSLPKYNQNLIDSLQLDVKYKDLGFHFSFDYRFYLKKENKYPAPRGVYFAPYYTFNYLNRTNTWHINTSTYVGDVNTNYKLNIHMLGLQLGYQFVIKDRWAIDLILFGPGIGYYGLNASLNTELALELEGDIYEKLEETIAKRFPGFYDLVNAGSFENSASFRTLSGGFRYAVHMGYRF
jgi:hypothetical protein